MQIRFGFCCAERMPKVGAEKETNKKTKQASLKFALGIHARAYNEVREERNEITPPLLSYQPSESKICSALAHNL
jgi:hypothetical protein